MAPSASGFLREYPLIRVDRFTSASVPIPEDLPKSSRQDLPEGATSYSPAALYLLTHIHTDHLQGLEQRGHDVAPIYCSPTTKQLLLRYERTRTRAEREQGKGDVIRPFGNLRESRGQAQVKGDRIGSLSRGRDLLKEIPLRTPTIVPYAGNMCVRLTLLDANHMQGAVMFLVEGCRGAVLHTGDLRAEPWFCNALVRDPLLRPYMARQNLDTPSPMIPKGADDTTVQSRSQRFTTPSVASTPSEPPTPLANSNSLVSNTSAQSEEARQALGIKYGPLRNIYVDDEALFVAHSPLGKEQAGKDMCALMHSFPPCTRFFIDAWCWGYEDLLHAIFSAFGGYKIHVDAYKRSMYAAAKVYDNHLPAMVYSRNAGDEGGEEKHEHCRMHACEREAKCDLINADLPPRIEDSPRPLIVRIAPPMTQFISAARWSDVRRGYEDTLRRAKLRQDDAAWKPWPKTLLVPFERHSPLQEIRNFVAVFKPLRVTPNTGKLQHAFIMAKTFPGLLANGGAARMEAAARAALGPALWRTYDKAWKAATVKGSVAALPSLNLTHDDEGKVEAELNKFHKRARRAFMSEKESPRDADARYEREKEKMKHRSEDASQPDANLTLVDEQHEATGYDGDVSGAVATGAFDLEADLTRSQQRLIVPLPGPALLPPPNLKRMNKPLVSRMEQKDAGEPAVLDEELATRYLSYAGTYLGWKIANPGKFTQVKAWRAVRRQKPTLAKEVEEAVRGELNIVPPLWTLEDRKVQKELDLTLPDQTTATEASAAPSRSTAMQGAEAEQEMQWQAPALQPQVKRGEIAVATLGDPVALYQPKLVRGFAPPPPPPAPRRIAQLNNALAGAMDESEWPMGDMTAAILASLADARRDEASQPQPPKRPPSPSTQPYEGKGKRRAISKSPTASPEPEAQLTPPTTRIEYEELQAALRANAISLNLKAGQLSALPSQLTSDLENLRTALSTTTLDASTLTAHLDAGKGAVQLLGLSARSAQAAALFKLHNLPVFQADLERVAEDAKAVGASKSYSNHTRRTAREILRLAQWALKGIAPVPLAANERQEVARSLRPSYAASGTGRMSVRFADDSAT